MSQIIIKPVIKWESLPFTKIQTRVYRLQNSIYKASKECNIKKLYKLQQYICNSSDVKITAIQKVSKNIKEHYFKKKINKTCLSSNDKWIIYQNLWSSYYISDQYIKYFLEQVQQYIIYICIKPEWKAKIEFTCKLDTINVLKYSSSFHLNVLVNKYINNRLMQYIIHYSKFDIKYKYIDMINFKCQICTIGYIENILLDLSSKRNFFYI